MSVYALGDTTHFRVAMPVKLLSFGDYDIKESEFGLSLDRKCDNAMRRLYTVHDLIDFRYVKFVDLFD